MSLCPVCGQPVDAEHAPSSTYGGKTYSFACPRCTDRFDEDPDAYAGAASHPVCH